MNGFTQSQAQQREIQEVANIISSTLIISCDPTRSSVAYLSERKRTSTRLEAKSKAMRIICNNEVLYYRSGLKSSKT